MDNKLVFSLTPLFLWHLLKLNREDKLLEAKLAHLNEEGKDNVYIFNRLKSLATLIVKLCFVERDATI